MNPAKSKIGAPHPEGTRPPKSKIGKIATSFRQRWARRPQPGAIDPDAAVVDGDFLHKLDRLSLGVGQELISGLIGEHRAKRRTTGIEFADYRPYSPGDDIRRVDWNAYARLGTLHVRQAEAEHDTVLYLLVDASPSMEFGRPSKFLAARRLTAALGYIGLSHLDSVVITAPGSLDGWISSSPVGQGNTTQNPKSKTQNVKSRLESGNLFRYLQGLRVGEAATFDNILGDWSTGRDGGRGGRLAVLVSDLLLDAYQRGVRQLVSAGFEVTILHVLSPEELNPSDKGDVELIDSETGQRMELHLGKETLAEYHRRLDAWLAETESWCRGQGATYLLVRSDWDIDRVLLESLKRRGVTA